MRKFLALIMLATALAACSPRIQSIRQPVDPNQAGAITIPHTMGEAVLPGPALRVVALEWTYVENLLALGIQPVGVADIEGFNTWVNVPVELSTDVVDVGMRGEPDFETLAALQPDLIIDTQATAAGYYEQLDAIAPTLVFNPYPDDPNLSTFEEMQDSFRLLGQATGRSDVAEQVLADLDAKIAEGRTAIEASGHAGEGFVLSQMMSWLNTAYLRFFIDNGMATNIVEQLGLENAWESDFAQYGFAEVGTEALTEVGDVYFFYVMQHDDGLNTSGSFQKLWESLPFVQSGKAHAIGGDTWLFGGPLSAEVLIDRVVAAVTE